MSNSDNNKNNYQTKQLIIGAGFVGLGMAQALKEAGINYDQVDASNDLGGNWHHGVYETAHIISSRKVTEFECFPMPESYPDFPSRENMRDYIHSFADHFDLRSQVELNRKVISVLPVEDNLWQVKFEDGEPRLYKGVIMCNGHHWCKRFPEFEGEFAGEIIHSKDYKKPQQLQGKKVLVIGGGNSACDIASEAARVGSKCTLSMRDSVWFIPKTFMGVPVADLGKKGQSPAWYQRLITYILIRLTFGKHETYGLPKPRHRVYDKHPTINNEVPYYIKHGRIIYKPGVRRLDGKSVEFTDGSRDEFDLIVCATGYYVAYPFLPTELQRVKGSVVQCYGDCFLPDYKGLSYIGWYQPRSGIGSVIGAFAPIFARYLQLQDKINIPLGLVLKEIGNKPRQTHLVDPNDIYQQVAQTEKNFDKIAQKARQIDAKYADFYNQPLKAEDSLNETENPNISFLKS